MFYLFLVFAYIRSIENSFNLESPFGAPINNLAGGVIKLPCLHVAISHYSRRSTDPDRVHVQPTPEQKHPI